MTTTTEKLTVDELTERIDQIHKNLSASKAELEESRLGFRKASFEAINGTPGAEKEIEAYRAKMNEAQADVEKLSAYLEVAEEKLEEARAEEREAKHRAMVEKAEMLIAERETVVHKIEESLSSLGESLKRGDDLAHKLYVMNRTGHHPMCERSRVERFTEALYNTLPVPYQRMLRFSLRPLKPKKGFLELEQPAQRSTLTGIKGKNEA